MAQTLTVKPQYVNTAQVFIDGKFILLNNNLTQEQLLAVWQKAEFRQFIDITYTNVADSFPENFEIDPNLFHAYDSGEITHDPTKTNYLPNSLGKHLNETRGKVDFYDDAFGGIGVRPIVLLDFANSRFLDPRFSFTRSGTATYIDRNGYVKKIAANKPRFQHDPMTKECLGLLLEESRTNYLLYTDDFTNAVWGKGSGGNSTIVSPSLYATPSNELKAAKIQEGSNNGSHLFSQSITVNGDGKSTISFWAKALERSNIRIESNAAGTSSSGWRVDINLSTGQFTETGIGSVPGLGKTKTVLFPDGWLKIEIVLTPQNTGNTTRALLLYTFKDGSFSYQGDGTSGFLLYGPQLELGGFATSYMPCSSSVSTRGVDAITVSGDIYNEIFSSIKEGTIYLSAQKGKQRLAGDLKQFYRFTGSAGNQINTQDHYIENIYSECWSAGVQTFSGALLNATFEEWFQMAFALSSSDSIVYANGNALGVNDTSVSIAELNTLTIGNGISTIIKQFAFWPKRLSNSELKRLTNPSTIVGKKTNQIPSMSDFGGCAFLRPESLLRSKSRQEFSVDGTGASVTRNIRRDYDFTFEIVDSSGVTLTAQPTSSCSAGTDNALTFTAPLGKTLTYAITPVYEN